MNRPLLILSCSQRKDPAAGLLAAYRRYDGPAYRTLRASGYPDVLTGPPCRVLVLSAEYGLISAYRPIPSYNRLLDADRAAALAEADLQLLRQTVQQPLDAHDPPLQTLRPTAVLVWGGALYRSVIARWQQRGLFAKVAGPITYSSGGIGEQLGQLKRWLAAQLPPTRSDGWHTAILSGTQPAATIQATLPQEAR